MKKLVACLMIACSLLAFGCSGRSAKFGVVDMKKVEAEATVVKEVREDMTKKAQELQDKLQKDTAGKSQEEGQKIAQELSGQMQVAQAEAQNKLKASLDAALAEIAKEKNLTAVIYKDVVPQGGEDITQDVIDKMK